MLVTWTVLRSRTPVPVSPWTPVGASWWTAGHSSPGRAQAPAADGVWWSVLAAWDDADAAAEGPGNPPGADVWHLLLEPVSAHGDVALGDGVHPFDDLPDSADLDGAAALITVAGDSPDDAREREFFRRFLHVSRDVAGAAGNLVALVHAPDPPGSGPVLTLSVWEDLQSGLDWAYARSRPHTSAVTRQRAHRLVGTSGSVRCAVRASRGSLGDLADPVRSLTSS